MEKSKELTIIDLPAMNLQAHCHEGSNEGMRSSTHLKEYSQLDTHIPVINSYQFAIGHLYANALGLDVTTK